MADSDSLAAMPAAPPVGPRAAAAVVAALVILIALGWLLARLVWLWFFFGLFFFLLAGSLTGALVFPILRPTRPVAKGTIVALCAFVAVAGWIPSVVWEHRFIVHSAGDVPHFSAARNALVAASQPAGLVDSRAEALFTQLLERDFAPGGLIGYVRWAVAKGSSELTLADLPVADHAAFTDHVAIPHHGWRWPARAAVCVGLLFLGLWWQLVALRAPLPTSNLIDPDEADELEREEIWEAGEPGYRTFEHTADVGLEARGKNWQALLEQSARGLLATIGALVPDPADRGEVVHVALKAAAREDLLHDWLAEILYQFETRRTTIDRIRFHATDESHVEADVTWRRIDLARTRFHREVKAVTYHDLKIEPWKRGLSARVILDI